ncbi:MAG: Lamin Tail Domain [Planctomycetota bacterium]|jgi:hypothetical protein
MRAHQLVVAGTALLATAAAATGQSVVLSEIVADGADRWVEIHNRGTATADLSQWTLYQATATPGQSGAYWWPFPAGTTLAGGGFLRVHWRAPVPANRPANEFYTGDATWHFLFGNLAEPLAQGGGALALVRTQNPLSLNVAALIEDWVSWGQSGLPRESLAVQAGRWTTGGHLAPVAAGHSMARNVATIGTLAAPLQWFDDPTPTPLGPNLGGASITAYGAPCAPSGNHLLGAPLLRSNAMPLLGNAQFALQIDNTTGLFGEAVLVAFADAAAAAGTLPALPNVAGVACDEAIDRTRCVAVWFAPSATMATFVPLPLGGLGPSFVGLELHAQALVVQTLPNAWPPFEGLTNALRLVLGQ